jgi:hypothetical protein
MILFIYIRKVPRVIKRNLTNGHVETIGNKRTEGHGLIPPTNPNIQPTSILTPNNISNQIKSIENNKFLKIKPKPYISFD